jgi:hypothetical protein
MKLTPRSLFQAAKAILMGDDEAFDLIASTKFPEEAKTMCNNFSSFLLLAKLSECLGISLLPLPKSFLPFFLFFSLLPTIW